MADNLTELEQMVLSDLVHYDRATNETALKWLEDLFTDRELLHTEGRPLLIMWKAEQADAAEKNKLAEMNHTKCI